MRRFLSNCLDRDDLDVGQFYCLIKNVSKTLTNFFMSTSNEVSTDHLPTSIHQELDAYKMMASLTYSTVHFTGFGIRSSLSSITLLCICKHTQVLERSQKVWQQMKDEKNYEVKLDHDGIHIHIHIHTHTNINKHKHTQT